MRRRFGASYKLIPIEKAVAKKVVVEIGGATVDGVLSTAVGPVAIELLGYSPCRDRGDVMERDFKLRRAVKADLYKLLERKGYCISLRYREIHRAEPGKTKVKAVPTTRDHSRFIGELSSIIAVGPELEFCETCRIRFGKAQSVGQLNRWTRDIHLVDSEYPLCAKYLDHMELQGVGELIPDVGSNLRGGVVGLDGHWVREHVATKARKSMLKSCTRANGLPLWLIVHSDGHAIHQSIPEVHRPRAVQVCQTTLAGTVHGFSRCYWADRTAFLDAAWISRVV